MPNHFNQELGGRIRTAREGKMTQAQLGERVGLSRTAITNIECGRQRLLVDQLVDIALVLGVPSAQLLPKGRVASTEIEHAVTDMPTVQRWLLSVDEPRVRGRQ